MTHQPSTGGAEEVGGLRAQLAAALGRIEELERELAAARASAVATPAPPPRGGASDHQAP